MHWPVHGCLAAWVHITVLTPYSSCCATGGSRSIMNPVSSWPRYSRAVLYGKTDMAAGKPHLVAMAAKQIAKPPYLIQVGRGRGFTLYQTAKEVKAEHGDLLCRTFTLMHHQLFVFLHHRIHQAVEFAFKQADHVQ